MQETNERTYVERAIAPFDRPEKMSNPDVKADWPGIGMDSSMPGNVGHALAHLEMVISSGAETTAKLAEILAPIFGPEAEVLHASVAPSPPNCALAEYLLGYANKLAAVNMDLITILDRIRL